MWLEKIFWYMLLLLKYIISCGIVSAIIIYFFPTAGLIVGGFLLLGSFGAAYEDLKEEIVPKLEYEQLKKLYNKAFDEFEGFDEMAKIVQKNM
jgi:hypothetical protein